MANGLYTLGGILLTIATPDLPKWVRITLWVAWLAGIGMTVAAFADHALGMIVTSIILFPPLVIGMFWLAVYWRPAANMAERRVS